MAMWLTRCRAEKRDMDAAKRLRQEKDVQQKRWFLALNKQKFGRIVYL